eukprot:2260650-Ditylum_brightwellii.AAC.1
MFVNNVNVIKQSEGNKGEHPRLVKYIKQQEDNEDSLMKPLSMRRYSKLLDDLSNAFLKGKDEYPNMLVAAHKLLASWENRTRPSSGNTNGGIAFATEGYEEMLDEEEK